MTCRNAIKKMKKGVIAGITKIEYILGDLIKKVHSAPCFGKALFVCIAYTIHNGRIYDKISE